MSNPTPHLPSIQRGNNAISRPTPQPLQLNTAEQHIDFITPSKSQSRMEHSVSLRREPGSQRTTSEMLAAAAQRRGSVTVLSPPFRQKSAIRQAKDNAPQTARFTPVKNVFPPGKGGAQGDTTVSLIEKSNSPPGHPKRKGSFQVIENGKPDLPLNTAYHHLKSQLLNLDEHTFRTFDRSTGEVDIKKDSAIPQRLHLVRKKYYELWQDVDKVRNAEDLVARLPLTMQKDYAVESIHRAHEVQLQEILAKGVFSKETAITRVNAMLRITLEHIVGHLAGDTRELSYIRIHNAATDQVLWKEAERDADAEIAKFHSKILPPHTSMVQLLSLALESYTQTQIPLPPRAIPEGGGNRPHITPGAGRIQRRPSLRVLQRTQPSPLPPNPTTSQPASSQRTLPGLQDWLIPPVPIQAASRRNSMSQSSVSGAIDVINVG